MHARSWILTPLFLVACSSAAAPPPPPPLLDKPTPAPTVAATPAPSAASVEKAPPTEKRAPDPLPKLDTKELDEKLLFLSSICPTAAKRDEKGNQKVGCSTCVTESVKPDGTFVMDPESFYELRGWVKGSFTRPGAEQIAATLDGCESHAENWGGTLVAEKRDQGHALVRYDSGVHPDACVPFRRKDGRDVLVCRWGDGHQSRWHDNVFSYDFERSKPDDVEKGWDILVTMDDDSTAGCMGVEPGTDVRAGKVESYALKDEDGDGQPELVVEVSQARSKPNKAYEAACKKWEESMENGGPPVDVAKALGTRKKSRLVFSYDGTKFVPTKATAGVLKGL